MLCMCACVCIVGAIINIYIIFKTLALNWNEVESCGRVLSRGKA